MARDMPQAHKPEEIGFPWSSDLLSRHVAVAELHTIKKNLMKFVKEA